MHQNQILRYIAINLKLNKLHSPQIKYTILQTSLSISYHSLSTNLSNKYVQVL